MAIARSLSKSTFSTSMLVLAVLVYVASAVRANDRDRQTLLTWTAGWNILVWPAGSTLSGCFFLGERAHRAVIVSAASEWSQAGNIHFDFGHAPGYRDCDSERPSDLRIGFRMSLASQSRMGTLACDASPGRPNVFLGLGDVATRPIQEIREAALHELGHFLGLPHEHQHAASPCPAEFKIQAICERQDTFASYSDRERADMLDMMQSQVRLRRDPTTATQPAYDVASIMHYRFPAGLLRGGVASACHTLAARTLADGDRAKMRARYPDEAGAQHDFLRAQALAIAQAIQWSGLDRTTADRVARLAEHYVARVHRDLDFSIGSAAAQLAAAHASPMAQITLDHPAIVEAAQCQPRAP